MNVPVNNDSVISYPVAGFLRDAAFTEIQRVAGNSLRETRFFMEDPETPIQEQSRQYMLYLKALGVSKQYVKWLVPIYTNETVRGIAPEIYGYDLSPIPELGTRKVSSYIRYLLFTRGWSQDAATQHLVDKLGYAYTSARPMIRRILRNEEANRALHMTPLEADKFTDLVAVGN